MTQVSKFNYEFCRSKVSTLPSNPLSSRSFDMIPQCMLCHTNMYVILV